jgi:hypothetical protein
VTDSRTFALGMAAAAWLVGLALHINNGYYNPGALAVISAAMAVAAFACVGPAISAIENLTSAAIVAMLAAAFVVEAWLLWRSAGDGAVLTWGAAALAVVALLQFFDLRGLRSLFVATMLVVFTLVASTSFRNAPTPHIDVLMFQQMGAAGLLRGENPYVPRYPNLYESDTAFYGPGVVDANNHLTVGLPYPPLSLLVALPAYVLGGDCRYADVIAIAAAAGLMFFARPGRWTAMIAALYLLTPRVLFVVEYGWTEALFAGSFSFLMFCAVRWRRALPYALGIFLATKQYSVFAVPFLPLLFDPPDAWRHALRAFAIAVGVAAAVTLPFVMWDPYAFWRSIVEFQFVQPLRMDALSHLVWIHKYLPGFPLQQLIPWIALVTAAAIALWRSQPTPAYFAGSLALVQLIFFAFSKQAFSNYYYYVLATMWWGAAASLMHPEELRPVPRSAS